MTELRTTVVAVTNKGGSQKGKKAAAAPKKPKAKGVHPPTSEMVINAIKMLNERGGSSLSAIKKYLAGNYNVDVDKLALYIKKYLKSAVSNGVLIQTKGKGASGSFKLSKSIAKVKSIEVKEKKPVASEKEKSAGSLKKQLAYVTKVGKKTKAKTSHPPTWEMVNNAIKMLNKRGGSSLSAIKKYIAENYNVDVDKMALYIKKYLKIAVSNGVLIQTKGKGAGGSFKLSQKVTKKQEKEKAADKQKKQLISETKIDKKTKAKTSHPPTWEMVNNAIKMLNKRGGSSLPAIKKYIAENYNVDGDKMALYIKKYLKIAVSNGVLIQTKGKGAGGSFKLSQKVTKKQEKEKAADKQKKQLISETKIDKKTKAKTSHPPTWEMVNNAIKMLNKRGGSSLPAIKKYIAENYNVDVDKLASYIKKYLKIAVSNGVLIQTKGKGASGSFKLSRFVKPTKVLGDSTKKQPTTEKTVEKSREIAVHSSNSLLQNLQMLQQNLQNQLN